MFEVRVELGDAITDEELRHDLAADPFHWLLEFQPRLAHASSGRVMVDLTIPGPDVWTTALTTMAVLRQSAYGLHALHVVTQVPSSRTTLSSSGHDERQRMPARGFR